MACMKLGSKPEAFHLDGQIWTCNTGLPSDVIIEVGEISFHLHKFPLLSRSGVLEARIADYSGEDETKCVLQLHEIPGGAKAFLLVAKFCYGVKMDITSANVVSLRCAAEYLRMTEDYGEGNLITQTETFLNEVFSSWEDSIKVLETCEEVLAHAEELHIVSRCIDSLASKACVEQSLFSWPVNNQSPHGAVWNGIQTPSKPIPTEEDWWYNDISFLRMPLYKRFIVAVEGKGMKPEKVAGSVIFYAKKYLPLSGRQANYQDQKNVSSPIGTDQRTLVEEVVELLPDQKDIIPTSFLLKVLRISMILHSSPSSQESLEKRIGSQLDHAALEDLLIPNTGYSIDTLYDIDCIQRILDYFLVDKEANDSSSIIEEGQSNMLTPISMVANLVDGYLAEVAPDVNLKLAKFQSLAAGIPDYARSIDDGIYRAIDIYLKAHNWMTESEREQICKLMNCQKLSLEASTHAAQNERLPLRVIVQVLFFEQLRLRTSITGWFFVTDDSQTAPSGNLALTRAVGSIGNGEDCVVRGDDMRDRVLELEKECSNMKQELDKLVRTRANNWNVFFRKLGLRLKGRQRDMKRSKGVPATVPNVSSSPGGAHGEGNGDDEGKRSSEVEAEAQQVTQLSLE